MSKLNQKISLEFEIEKFDDLFVRDPEEIERISLKQEYDEILKNQKYPLELIRVVRGVVYEELAEIYVIYARQFADLAYDDMSKDEWYKKLEPKRIGRMYELKEKL